MKKKIKFDTLMKSVQFYKQFPKESYILKLNGKSYCFKNTEEVVPFVEEELGYEVEQ